MNCLVVLSAALACVSSVPVDVPLDAGYGVPVAPLVHSVPLPLATHPLAPIHPIQQQFTPLATLVHPEPTRVFHAVSAPAAVPVAGPALVATPFAAPVPVAAAPAALPITSVPSTQFHAQDEFGQHSFGYQNVNSARQESKDAFGVTRGSYQYVDANGILQTTQYVADPVNGFRVAATNIPVAVSAPHAVHLAGPAPVAETAEVAAATAEHLAAHAAAVNRLRREAEPTSVDYAVPAAPVLGPAVQVAVPAPVLHHAVPAPVFRHAVASPVVHAGPVVSAVQAPLVHAAPFVNAAPFVHSAPLVNAAPFASAASLPLHTAPLPVAPQPIATPLTAALPITSVPSTQFHAQDEFGQHSFGYQNVNSARHESKDAFGVTRGSYQYVDANGILQTTHYVADPVNGFRVAATNIPVAVSTPHAAVQVAASPLPVVATPEVAAATAEHLAAHAAAKIQA